MILLRKEKEKKAKEVKEKKAYRTSKGKKKWLMFFQRNSDKKEEDETLVARQSAEPSIFAKDDVLELIAPDGVNPIPLGYFTINDQGKEIYVRNFYIEKLPKRSTFAETFSHVFNFSNSTVSVFINPLLEGKASKQIDNQINSLDSERLAAQEKKDRNRERKITKKMKEAEEWAILIESGENSMFEVGFLITIFAESLDELDIKSGDLFTRGKEKGMEICATYAYHPEAFQMNTPINMPIDGLIKTHIMDKFSLSTIFNHTRSEFHHEKGITLGRNMNTGKPVTFDIYDPSHNGYNISITGTTNAGKSTTVKVLMARYKSKKYRFVSLDSEPRGTKGEYSLIAERLNGVNYEIHSKSNNIINLFEISEETEYDEITKTETLTLKLKNKITDVKHIILTMIRADHAGDSSFEVSTFVQRIVTDIVTELYNEKGIYDEQVDSLYEVGEILENGVLTTGKRKKELPTITEFYLKALYKRKKNTNPNHALAYDVIIATMKDYVRELYVCEECLTVFTKEEYLMHVKDVKSICPHCNSIIERIEGLNPYYDGQSTITIDYYTPHTNIDISQLHDKDKPVAQQIALNFINENFIKKNSQDPKKAEKLVVIFDETHKMFPYEEARKFIVDIYRTARKRLVSAWTCTQRLADYALYEECMAIITNSTALFILRHAPTDKKILKEHTILTDAQIELTTSLDKGEVMLIDNKTVVQVKIDLLDIEKDITDTDMSSVKERYMNESIGER